MHMGISIHLGRADDCLIVSIHEQPSRQVHTSDVGLVATMRKVGVRDRVAFVGARAVRDRCTLLGARGRARNGNSHQADAINSELLQVMQNSAVIR